MPSEALNRGRLSLTIDGRAVVVPEGVTVLRAAELAGVTMPSLCSHRELSSFGSCRLCAVEIDGRRGHPLACDTPAADGMAVTTDSAELRETRREILQLILAAHPSSCLFCDENDQCARNQRTIRKAGVTTGCRSCPNDGDCELQRVVDLIGVDEAEYTTYYRGLPAEHDDPFYDRDYNLCILCGRCVRVCREVRGTSVLTFIARSRSTVIGSAFGRSRLEAGCEFCGACVSVCPTGALADKVSKWDGKPDGVEVSTCPFCGLGCRLELAHAGGALSAARGAYDPEINDGQLCVRGRFCLPETTHHPARARKPMLRRGTYQRVESWEAALDEVAGRLARCDPGELLVLASPDLTNEALYAAQRFVRVARRSNGIDSTARVTLPGGPATWSRLFSLPISLEALGRAEAVVTVGLATRFSFSVAGVQARRAVRRGARLVAVDARESSLAKVADEWVRAASGAEAAALIRLLAMLDGDEPPEWPADRSGHRPPDLDRRLAAAARVLDGAGTLSLVIAPRVFQSLGAAGLPAALEKAAARPGTTVLPLARGANVRGVIELGALGEVLPGPRPTRRRGLSLDDVRRGTRPAVLYLIGESPFSTRPDCDYLIAQDLYAPPYAVDAFLPAASFAETEGTLISLEGRVQELRPVEREAADPVHGYARPDWWILAQLAGRLGSRALDFASAADVRTAIRAEVAGFPAEGDRRRRRMTPFVAPLRAREPVAGGADEVAKGRGRFLLVTEAATFRHRGIDLADVVEGLGELRLAEGLRMNPDDLAHLGVAAEDPVTVALDGRDLVLATRPDPACPRGTAYVSRGPAWEGPVRPRHVRISAGDRSRRSRRVPAGAWVRETPGGGGDAPGR